MIAENDDVGNSRQWHAGFFRQLGIGAVLIQAHHRGEAFFRQAFGLASGDHAIGVAGIANHGDAAVIGGDGVDALALADKDLAVVF